MTGSITLDGERLDVDCYAMRDRSWGRRVPTPGLHIGYDLCAEARSAFVVFSQPDAPGSPVVENFGYLWRDGEQLPLQRGSRVLERDGVWPTPGDRARPATPAGAPLEAVGDGREPHGVPEPAVDDEPRRPGALGVRGQRRRARPRPGASSRTCGTSTSTGGSPATRLTETRITLYSVAVQDPDDQGFAPLPPRQPAQQWRSRRDAHPLDDLRRRAASGRSDAPGRDRPATRRQPHPRARGDHRARPRRLADHHAPSRVRSCTGSTKTRCATTTSCSGSSTGSRRGARPNGPAPTTSRACSDAQQQLAAADSPAALHDANDEFLRTLLALARSPRLGSVMRNMSTVVPGNFFELIDGSGPVQQRRHEAHRRRDQAPGSRRRRRGVHAPPPRAGRSRDQAARVTRDVRRVARVARGSNRSAAACRPSTSRPSPSCRRSSRAT